MAVKIRLARGGRKKLPYYSIVVANSTAARDGRFIEKVGTYNPLLADNDGKRVTLNAERVAYWLGTGAIPTERVEKFIKAAGITPVRQAAAPKAPKVAAPKKAAAPKKKAAGSKA